MSTYAFMRWLESTPERYDRGLRILSRGRLSGVRARMAELSVEPGDLALDVGCGTGAVALALAARGASVLAVDRDAGMLGVARTKPVPQAGSVRWQEVGVAEVEDQTEPESFDAATSCLAFSEFSAAERSYALKILFSRLRPGGRLVIGDEVEPQATGPRLRYRLGRLPMVIATWLLTQRSTRPVPDLPGSLRAAGFVDIEQEHPWPSFAIVHGRRPA